MLHSITWLITSTTYGTWLPGDKRGFVSRVRDFRSEDYQEVEPHTRVMHNKLDTDYDRAIPGLRTSAQSLLNGDPIYFNNEQAVVVCNQFVATGQHRGWVVQAIAVMSNHFHIVLTAPASVKSESILRDLKSYASRELNKRWPRPESGRWWTRSGSRREKQEPQAVTSAIRYVLKHQALAMYSSQDT